MLNFAYRDVISWAVLDSMHKEIVIIAMSTAASQLKVHINAALNMSLSRTIEKGNNYLNGGLRRILSQPEFLVALRR